MRHPTQTLCHRSIPGSEFDISEFDIPYFFLPFFLPASQPLPRSGG